MTNLSVVVLSDNFQQAVYFASRLLNLFRKGHVECNTYLQKIQIGKVTAFTYSKLTIETPEQVVKKLS